MDSCKQVLLTMRVISALMILLGFLQMGSGWSRSMKIFTLNVPAWMPGTALAALGVRYWFRLDKLQRKTRKENL
jgi:hypothetical protein